MDYRPARMLAFVIKRLLLLGALTMATPANAGISFVGAGTVSTNGQPSFPSGKLTNDILVAVCGNATATPTGWTLAVGSADGKFRVFWRRSSSDTAPSFGSGARCRMAAYRGAVATGSPFEAVGAVAQASDTYTGWGTIYKGPAPASITTLTSNATVLQASYAWGTDIETCSVSTAAGGPAPTVAFGETTGHAVVGLNHGLKQSPGATGSGANSTLLEFQDTGEYSAYSALLGIQPASCYLSGPGVPGAITGPVNVYIGTYTIAWGASTGTVDRYELYENGVLVYSGPALSKAFDGRAHGTYTYKAKACNCAGCSEFTQGLTVTNMCPENVRFCYDSRGNLVRQMPVRTVNDCTCP